MFKMMSTIFTSPAIMELFEYCLKNLSDKIKRPEFSWYMPGNVPKYPKIEEFLKSEREQMNFHGGFTWIVQARKVATELGTSNSDYSIKLTPMGIGSKAYLEITKTQENYQRSFIMYNQKVTEYEKFRKIIEGKQAYKD